MWEKIEYDESQNQVCLNKDCNSHLNFLSYMTLIEALPQDKAVIAVLPFVCQRGFPQHKAP